MTIQKITIDGNTIIIPAGYEPAARTPDDPPGFMPYELRTQHAECRVLFGYVDKSQVLPRDQKVLIDALRTAMNEDQGLIRVEASPAFIYTIIKMRLRTERIGYKLICQLHEKEGVLQAEGQFDEQGTKGLRDLVVYDLARKEGIMGRGEDPLKGWARDPYDDRIQTGTLMNASELEEFDKRFPDFPLTLCREMVNTLTQYN